MFTHSNQKQIKLKTHHKSNFVANGRNALAKSAYRYGFRNVQNGFICAPDGPRSKVLQLKAPGDLTDATEVPTTNIALDLEYTVPVTIGTPGVTLNLDLDSGSSDLWVWSTEARVSTAAKKKHELYDPSKSKTSKLAKGLTWEISYGDGSSASGDVHQDQVQLGNLAVDNMSVEVAKKLSNSFIQDVQSDGLLGMAWDSINTVQPTPVETLLTRMMPLLEKPIFTCNLMHGSGGFYTFGSVDESVTSTPIQYTLVDNSTGFWKVAAPTWSLQNEEMPTSFGNAIMDTGTTLLLVDDATCAKFYEAIPGSQLNAQQGGYTFPQDAAMPEVSFYVGEAKITMAPETIAYGEPDADGNVFGSIQSSGDLGFAIFGDAFLKNCYVVFDHGGQTLGAAQKPFTADL